MFGMNRQNFVKGMAIGIFVGTVVGMGGMLVSDGSRRRNMGKTVTKNYKRCKALMHSMF